MTKPKWPSHLAKVELKKGTATMKKSSTALSEIPGWYIEFQAAVLRQLPRPGQIDQLIAEGWTDNQRSLKDNLFECLVPPTKKVFKIDRTQPFNLKEFFGDGWTIAKEYTDSLKLIELDLNKVKFKDMLKEDETSVNDREKQKRLEEAGYIRLDAKIFQTLWDNQKLIPSSWKEPISGDTRYIFFDGTILCRFDGRRYVLSLFWNDGKWFFDYRWLGSDWDANDLSAVLIP